MSLLPRDTVTVPGLDVSGACIPAREVGGDYYDVIRLGERRLGVLVADVSGKGTPAAFYMAELKGLVLSLSRVHDSPRRLLIEVNRLLAGNMESGRFITMMYAVFDSGRNVLTCARAGHGPLIHVPGRGGVRVVAPDGLIAGLPGFEQRFETMSPGRDARAGEGRPRRAVHGRHHGGDEPGRGAVRRAAADTGAGGAPGCGRRRGPAGDPRQREPLRRRDSPA